MGIYSENTETKLNDLLEKSYDAEKGFEKAHANVDSAALKSFFNSKVNERLKFRTELISELKANGYNVIDDNNSLEASIDRTWMDTKAMFSSDKEQSMLEEVRNGEKATLNDYNDVLEDNKLPPTTASILTKHRNAIESSYKKADYLEEIL